MSRILDALSDPDVINTIPISRAILSNAAKLRAITILKTPDSIHAATAGLFGCVLFLTNDPNFRRVPGLPVVLLSEIDD